MITRSKLPFSLTFETKKEGIISARRFTIDPDRLTGHFPAALALTENQDIFLRFEAPAGFRFTMDGLDIVTLPGQERESEQTYILLMDALDAGAEDFDASEDAAEITTDPENYSAVVKALEEKGYEILSDDLAMVPMTTTRLTDPDQLKAMGKLLDALEENDDVQNVWHSLENEEDLPE